MTIFSRDSISSWTSERSIFYQQNLFIFFCNLLNEFFWQCVLFQHCGQKAVPPPETSILYIVQTTHSFPFLSNRRYLHQQLIPFKLTNINQIQPYQRNCFAQNERTSLTQLRRDACASWPKQLTMAVKTNAIRGPLNSVLNSAHPTVCIKPLSECFHEWQLPESLSRKISPKQLTCKRVVKKYANMKKSPSVEFSRKLSPCFDSPRHPSSPLPPEPPSSLLPTNSANSRPNVMLKEKLLNGQTSENSSTEMQGGELNAKNAVGSIGSPNGKSLHAACNVVRRKYLKYWRNSLHFSTTVGGERRFLKNVRLCDVLKPGSDKCYHGQLPQNVRLASRQHISAAAAAGHKHSENVPCTYSQQRIRRKSRWNAEDKNIFSLLNQSVNTRNQYTKSSNRNDSEKNDKNIKNDFDMPPSDACLKNQLTSNPGENLPSAKIVIKSVDSCCAHQKLNSSSQSHSHSLNFLSKPTSAHHYCLGISDASLDDFQHVRTGKSNLPNDPLENPYEKSSHQTCFSEDSAFSSGSSSSSSSSLIESQTHVIKLSKLQRIKRKNSRQHNYFTNSSQEGPRIRRRRMCPCCIFPSPIKKRRRRSRTCRSDLSRHYQRFVESTLQLNSLRNKLHLFLTVLFPKLIPLLESISPESENIDHLLDEAVSLAENGQLVPSVDELTSEQSSSFTAAKSKPSENDNADMEGEVINSCESTRLLNIKINMCRSPDQCLARLREKSLTLISFLLPALTFKEADFYDTTSNHLEYLIDLVAHGNQSVSLSDGDS